MKLLLLLLLMERAASQQRGLFPAILNLASNAVISSNATCGDPEPEVYCKLVEHVPGRRIKNPHCPKCDANSVLFKERHPITNAIDGTNQWWQSPSIKNGRQFHWVTVTLDLKQVTDTCLPSCLSLCLSVCISGNWILERSLDGVTYDPWQFYAISDSECLSRYNITPRLGPPTYKRDMEVICTSYYSRLNPLEHGEIHTSLINGRPGADDLTSDLLNFTSARYIRLRLQRIRTLNADLMTLSAHDPRDIDPIVTRRYFYSIKDISVGGMCICYGHAQSCPLDPVTKKLQCVCEHNTCGESCNECCPGYHQQPWQPGTVSEGNTCEKCNCHNKAGDCFYNQTVADLRLSLNSHRVRQGGGVCIDCQQNTAGINCETCAKGYYRPAQVNVMGAHCDLCKPGFYNLQPTNPLGCTDCFCFGVSNTCESSGWSTAQILHTDAWLRPSQSYHRNLVIHGNDLHIPGNNSSGHTHQQLLSWAAPNSFQGNKLVSYGGFLNYTVVYDIPLDNEDRSLHAHSDIIMEGNGRAIHLSPPLVLFLSPLAGHSVAIEMVPQQFVDMQTGGVITHDDLLSVLTDVTLLRVRVHLNTHADIPIRLSSVSLDIADSGVVSGAQAVAVETCECPWGYSGTSCEGCTHNTTGPHCDQCLPGFYGDATEGTAEDCLRCPCPLTEPTNSFSLTCVLDTSGQVSCDQCQEGYTGNNCERCASGFYGNPQVVGGVCVPCECNGNVDDSKAGHCDTVTGECLRCLNNTAGRHCEVCQPGYYGDAVHAKNCQECSCDVSGALSSVCDVTTGQCMCRENVTGHTCDRCQSGFFGLQSGRGCQACGCMQPWSLSESCDDEGQCHCVEGVAGDKCDRCRHGYYGFHANSCTACSCEHTGGNCDPESGECICPPHSEGDTCDKCETGYWGHDPVTGCKPCSCSAAGSSAPQCDLTNGQCRCKEGFSGRSCDQCSPGHYGFPACSACGCDVAGTEKEFCNMTLGVCDCQHTGQCVCKVTLRMWITLARSPALLPLVSQSNLQGVISGVYQQGGDILLDTRQVNTSRLSGPLYWRMPHQFEGNQLLSYGGLLSYVVTFYAEDGSGLANQEPQVLMRGGTLMKLVIYTDMVAPGNGVRSQHDIRLTEHKWKYFNSVSEKPVSRADFMSVLSNIQYVIVKASYGTGLQQSRISNITMETAVDAEEAERGVARLIESCICPLGHAGLSCEECAPGYFHQPWSELSPQGQRSLFVRPCVPCRCNSHSESCDQETGDCQHCQHHTSGRSCELCAPGHYGNVSGSISDCSQCSCPLRDNSIAMAPYSQLVALENETKDIQVVFSGNSSASLHLSRVKDDLSHLTSDLSAMLQQVTHLSQDLDEVGVSTNNSLSQGALLLESISNLQKNIQVLEREAGYLNQTTEVEVDADNQTHLQEMLQQAHTQLSNAAQQNAQTHMLLDTTNTLLRRWQVKKTHTYSLVNTHTYSQVNTHLQPGDHSKSFHQNLSAVSVSVDQVMEQSQLLLADSFSMMDEINNSSAQVEVMGGQLDQWRPLLRKKVDGLFVGLKMTDALEIVYRAESHTHLLQNQTHSLHSALSPVCNLSQNGSQLVQLDSNITEWVNLAEQVTLIAQISASLALNMLNVSMVTTRLQLVRENISNTSFLLRQPIRELQSLSKGSFVPLQQVQLQAAAAHSGLQEVLQRLQRLRQQLHDSSSVVENTNNTVKQTNQLMTHTHTAANEAQRKLEEVEHRTEHLMNRIKPLSMLGETLSRNLSDIRELIDQARRQAASADFLALEMHDGKVSLLWDVGSGSIRLDSPGPDITNNRWTRINVTRPQTEETSFHFDGSGFSLVQKSLRATSTSVVLLFKTLSPSGLLLYLSSNNTRDFLSIELVGGRVRLTFDLGSGPLILTSNRKYNTGVWYKITLQRNKRKGHLSVMAADQSSEKEVLEAESPGMASDLNRSDLDPIYIGGLPASRPIRRQVISRSYAVRSVSVLSGGFVQIAPRLLGQEAELLFSFSSNNQSGVLLAAFSDDHTQRKHFLSVHLVSGSLEVELGDVGGATRRVVVVKPNGGSFTDRMKHSVIITINKKSLSVQIDEEHLKSVSLLPGGLSRLSLASFFIGGLPLGEESRLPIRLQNISRRFRGCIQHLVVGGALIDLSGAVRYEGAELDSCLLEERVGGALLPDDQDVEPTPNHAHLPAAPPTRLSALTPGALMCASDVDPSFLLPAAQFGSSRHSHMTFIISPNTVRRRLSVRSRAQNGLILFLSDSNQMDHAILRLAAGKLLMSADLGKGPSSVTSSVAINDGEWHTVSAEVSRRSVSVSVDGLSPDSVSVKGNQLDVNSRLYLGGLPHTHTTRRINVSSSLPGCLRSVSLNGAMLDLSKPASQHDITSCFTKDQAGSYFNGSGFAEIMREGFKVGSDVSVSLEFRTSQSEGVFLGISSAKVDAIGLEMINGQVVFNVNNGAGRVSVRSIGQILCDGQWHHLLARKTKHTLSLSVDGQSSTTPNPYPQSTSAETNNPIYLGGFPVGVKQNCLSISSRFRGCLRNMQLIKAHINVALDLSSAHFLSGITPNSCPVA
ncbi:hypothetical protein PAMA_008234 [Pampus argenteus]